MYAIARNPRYSASPHMWHGRPAHEQTIGASRNRFMAQRAMPQAPYNGNRRKRRALEITETELKVMAALAIRGLSSRPKNG